MSDQSFEDPDSTADSNEVADMLHVDREFEPPPGTEGIDLGRDSGPESDESSTEELINEAGGESDNEEL